MTGFVNPPIEDLINTGPFRDIDYYHQSGNDDFTLLRSMNLVREDSKIIDFGCAYGRIGQHIIDFLSNSGLYLGIDIDQGRIEWCKKNIGNDHAQFCRISDDGLPLLGQKVSELNPTVIISFSVFNHFSLCEIEKYLKVFSKSMPDGSRLLLTTYVRSSEKPILANPEKRYSIVQKEYDDGRISQDENGQPTFAHDERRIQNIIRSVGLQLVELRKREWEKGVDDPKEIFGVQDILLLQK